MPSGLLVARIALALLGVLAATVAVRLLTGGIATRGLLQGRTRHGETRVSPTRVQMLLATLSAAAWYLSQVAATGTLPDPPTWMLALLGGSHGIYLGAKADALLRRK